MSENKVESYKQTCSLNKLRLNKIMDIGFRATTDDSLRERFLVGYEEAKRYYLEYEKANLAASQYFVDDENELQKLNDETLEVDDMFYQIKLYSRRFEPSSNSTLSTSTVTSTSRVKIPKISLPRFDGELSSWPNFFELFKTLIHKDDRFSSIEKHQYLLSSLTDEPLRLIQRLPLTEGNYSIAFDILVSRYQNKRILATYHWNAIINTQSIKSRSSKTLNSLIDTFSENIAALALLGFPTSQWDFPLFQLLIGRLDSLTRSQFELKFAEIELPSYRQLENFVISQSRALQATNICNMDMKQNIPNYAQKKLTSSHSFVAKMNGSAENCAICPNQQHSLMKCPAFARKSPRERFQLIKELRLCINCLHSQHLLASCPSSKTCKRCGQRHHSLLHFGKDLCSKSSIASAPSELSNSTEQSTTVNNSPVRVLTNITRDPSTVLLATARVGLIDVFGEYRSVRALIDPGSQINIITEKCCQSLGLKRFKTHCSIEGLGLKQSTSKGLVYCKLTSLQPDCQDIFETEAVILPDICSRMPSQSFSADEWQHVKNLSLADPEFNVAKGVELLLGADIYSRILLSGHITGQTDEPSAINTCFGWIILGRTTLQLGSTVNSLNVTCGDECIGDTLRKFWELEEIVPTGKNRMWSELELRCDKTYTENVSRNEQGRYIVPLMFKSDLPTFENSREIALRRLLSIERRLVKDNELYESYRNFMSDYFLSGHMERVQPSEDNSNQYYIPHHCVMNLNSRTTKLRVVFDASTKDACGVSLNDVLLTGPKLQKDVFPLLIKLRTFRVVVIGDIRKMYRQIFVNPSETNYQRILWRNNPSEPVEDFRLLTVTYGVSSAPYLALRTVRQLALDYSSKYPLAAEVVLNDMYMDDIVSGGKTFEEANELKKQLIEMFSKGGFELHKWISSHHLLNESSENLECRFLKTLGLKWCPSEDYFTFDFVHRKKEIYTKRSILSEIGKIFDPLGILAPSTFFAKQVLQQLWMRGIDWDEEVPQDMFNLWSSFVDQLPSFAKIKLPRFVLEPSWKLVELHAFCDASEKGYSSVVYVRTTNDEVINVSFLCAKTRLAPLKRISIPRLELCAAHLLSELVNIILSSLPNFTPKIFAWSDSSVALSWIRSSPYRWKTFVANRVTLIQSVVPPSNWNHVRSEENPADVASRGLLPSDLPQCSLWWAGPGFLSLPSSEWKKSSFETNQPEVSCEERVISLVAVKPNESILDYLLSRFSSWRTINRVIAYCFRFIRNIRKLGGMRGNLSSHELKFAMFAIVRRVQQDTLQEIVAAVKRNGLVPREFRRLGLFIDDLGLLRVGGRLTHSNLAYCSKHPLLLSGSHVLTKLIIQQFHRQYLHPGCHALHYLLLQQFWIIGAKRCIRSCIAKCKECFRARPKSYQPPMGDLPVSRVSKLKPFSVVGVDFAGPFHVLTSRARGIRSQKAYLCLFVCYATKAIHLELASSLSTEAFLAALRRFIARRGKCSIIHSDCGTNFTGAARELERLMRDVVESETIIWKFNPPSAPHFGGLWEAGVKSVKSHLLRVIGQQTLTYEELNTVFVRIEAILNSRPLCALSADPRDLQVLSPGHFLNLDPVSSLPEEDTLNVPLSRLSRWQLITRMHLDFWKRWSREYLHTLSERKRWAGIEPPDIKVGDLVLIKNEIVPPSKWCLGRIMELHPGADDVVRVVTLKTATGSLKRPVVKLCPLPYQE